MFSFNSSCRFVLKTRKVFRCFFWLSDSRHWIWASPRAHVTGSESAVSNSARLRVFDLQIDFVLFLCFIFFFCSSLFSFHPSRHSRVVLENGTFDGRQGVFPIELIEPEQRGAAERKENNNRTKAHTIRRGKRNAAKNNSCLPRETDFSEQKRFDFFVFEIASWFLLLFIYFFFVFGKKQSTLIFENLGSCRNTRNPSTITVRRTARPLRKF